MRKAIETICNSLIVPAISAEVISVNKENHTCDVKPTNGAAEVLDVYLRSDDGKTNGQVVYPSVGSLVLIAPIDSSIEHYYVAMFSEVDEVACIISGTKMIAGKNGVTIAQGNDGLQEILIDMVSQILKIYAPMNKPGLIAIQKRIKQVLNNA